MTIINPHRKDFLKRYGLFVTLLSLFSVTFFIFQIINQRFWMHDFEVYYSAANAFLHGEKVYGVYFGLSSGFYKYSPFALLFFAPFSLLPFFAAKLMHLFALSSLLIINLILADKIIHKYFFDFIPHKNISSKLILVFFFLIASVYTEFHLGNINTMLLFINILAFQQLLKGKNLLAGLFFAVGILIKPHFIVFIPLLLLRKKFRCLGYMILGIFAGLFIPALFIGFQNNTELLNQWVSIILIHNNSLINSPDTLYSWMYCWVGHFFFIDAVIYDKVFALIILLLVSMAGVSLLIAHFRKEKKLEGLHNITEKNFVFEFFILLAVVPNIVPTDTEHFMFSIPLIIYIVNFLFLKRENIIVKAIGLILLMMYGMNMRELIGANLSKAYTAHGIIGLANLFIILFCIFIHTRQMNNHALKES